LTLTEYLFHLLQVFVLKRYLEQIIGVVDWKHFHLALSGQSIDLVAQKECQINWLFYAFECAGCLALEEHVFEVGRGGVNETISLVEAARFYL
jgi:hypothetical protein